MTTSTLMRRLTAIPPKWQTEMEAVRAIDPRLSLTPRRPDVKPICSRGPDEATAWRTTGRVDVSVSFYCRGQAVKQAQEAFDCLWAWGLSSLSLGDVDSWDIRFAEQLYFFLVTN